eukprot:scaffold58239_cov62-Phaeocystis_antarctica.AAC.4
MGAVVVLIQSRRRDRDRGRLREGQRYPGARAVLVRREEQPACAELHVARVAHLHRGHEVAAVAHRAVEEGRAIVGLGQRAALRGDLEGEVLSEERLVYPLDDAAAPAQPGTVPGRPLASAALAVTATAPGRVVTEAAGGEGHEELAGQALRAFELLRHRRDLHELARLHDVRERRVHRAHVAVAVRHHEAVQARAARRLGHRARVVLRGERARLERRCAHDQVLGPRGRRPRPVDADRARDGAGPQHADRIPGRSLEDAGTPRRRHVALEGEPLVASLRLVRAGHWIPVVTRGPANEGHGRCHALGAGMAVGRAWPPLVAGCSANDSNGSHVSFASTVPSSASATTLAAAVIGIDRPAELLAPRAAKRREEGDGQFAGSSGRSGVSQPCSNNQPTHALRASKGKVHPSSASSLGIFSVRLRRALARHPLARGAPHTMSGAALVAHR